MSPSATPKRTPPGSPFAPEVVLQTTDDLDRVVTEISSAYTIKGLFVAPLASAMSPEAWEAIKPLLTAPPRTGRYLPFIDYPQSDYHRLLLACARAAEPRTLPLAERLRRIARSDFVTFGNSVLGRVVMTVVGDIRAALLRTPSVYSSVSTGDWKSITAEVLGDDRIAVEFDNFSSNWPYQLGQFEGMVAYFGMRSLIDVSVGERYMRFAVNFQAK